ncbi:hypothetical protein ACHAO1_007493 [Botrytis cinerea]
MSDDEFQQIHRTLRPPRGNRRLESEVDDSEADDSEVATLAPNRLSVDFVTAHAAMVRLETAAKKSVMKSKVYRWRHFAVMLFELFNNSVQKTVLMILIGVLCYLLFSRGILVLDDYLDQREMVVVGAIWAGMLMLLFILMIWFRKQDMDT